jgi:predicted KAP-like P-loop ATPase
MGKSSIMRMLESELRAKRAAVTVWFNAWHHQKEDQLLACLMEAVQKQRCRRG